LYSVHGVLFLMFSDLMFSVKAKISFSLQIMHIFIDYLLSLCFI
jgi:hypothetical protein